MRSIRQILIVRIALGTALLLVVATVFMGILIRDLDVREYDEILKARAQAIAAVILREKHSLEMDYVGEYLSRYYPSVKAEYYQFRMTDGTVVERSDLLGKSDLPFLPRAMDKPFFRDIDLPDGTKGRFIQLLVPVHFMPKTSESAKVVVVLARSREDLDKLLRSIYAALAGLDVLLVTLISMLVSRTVRKGFQSVDDMNAQIQRLDAKAIDKRVIVPDMPVELHAVIMALNGFMDRVQAGFVRERRFASDVAHELRTPVAEIRAACEVGSKWPDDPVLVQRQLEGLHESSVKMERIVRDLLDLSRYDKGEITLCETQVRIADILDSCWSQCRKGEAGKLLNFVNKIDPGLVVTTDMGKLEMILQNLLDNAISYGTPQTDIICANDKSGGCVIISISNHAQGLNQDDIKQIFDRFWRKDLSRTGGRHLGLGLGLVETLADILNISIHVTLDDKGIFTVRLSLPD